MALETLTSATGTKVYIGPLTIDADTLTEFDAATGWVEIGGVETFPSFGVMYNTGSATPLVDGQDRTYKTNTAAISENMTALYIADDEGQLDCEAAVSDVTNKYPFKVEFSDTPSGAGAKPTRIYFKALVTGFKFQQLQAGNPQRVDIGISYSSADYVKGAPVAGS